jgi:hypothetical protein
LVAGIGMGDLIELGGGERVTGGHVVSERGAVKVAHGGG